MNLEEKVEWNLVMSQPRYAGGHEDVMKNIFGANAKIISWWHSGDYQGEVAIAYEFPNGEVAIMTDYYGSCSGCDAWECSSDGEAKSMILGLCGSARQFASKDEARKWCSGIDQKERPWEYPWQAVKNLSF